MHVCSVVAGNTTASDSPMPLRPSVSPTCGSCDERERDHGGCRCQAFLLTGSAEAPDPVCPKSPQHDVVQDIVGRARPSVGGQPLTFVPNAVRESALVYRSDRNSQRYIDGDLTV
jgi:pyrroloquinoline quinone biosynthesis protein E